MRTEAKKNRRHFCKRFESLSGHVAKRRLLHKPSFRRFFRHGNLDGKCECATANSSVTSRAEGQPSQPDVSRIDPIPADSSRSQVKTLRRPRRAKNVTCNQRSCESANRNGRMKLFRLRSYFEESICTRETFRCNCARGDCKFER